MKQKKSLSLTVGITTCYGNESMLPTVRSIRASQGVAPFRFIIIADRTPVPAAVKKELQQLDVELYENKTESGQFKKKKQLLKMVTSDILIWTNDDVLFDANALATIMQRFEDHPTTTMISIRNQPVPASNRFEALLSAGTSMVNRMATSWRAGDNHLALIGRCEAFRTATVRGWPKLPDEVVSTDQYLYYANRAHGGIFEFLPEVAVYFKNPQTFAEFLRKSSRFQHGEAEMAGYFSAYFPDFHQLYTPPAGVKLRAMLRELVANPVNFLGYLGVFGYSRWKRIDSKTSLNANWEVDVSTKAISL